MTAEHGNHKIYRYKLDSDINDLLIRFSNIHKYDSLDTFKEAWSNWCESNNNIIVGEEKRLQVLGFTGDVKEKMYIASRYYYRKRERGSGGNGCEVKCKQNRSYIILDKSLLKLMDAHISQFIIDIDYKPSTGFDNFYEINKKVIECEIERLINLDKDKDKDKDKDIYAKIKKTYKNRYFKLR